MEILKKERKKPYGVPLENTTLKIYIHTKEEKPDKLYFWQTRRYISLGFRIYIKANKKQLGLGRSQIAANEKYECGGRAQCR